jgi:hypothetical protein
LAQVFPADHVERRQRKIQLTLKANAINDRIGRVVRVGRVAGFRVKQQPKWPLFRSIEMAVSDRTEAFDPPAFIGSNPTFSL